MVHMYLLLVTCNHNIASSSLHISTNQCEPKKQNNIGEKNKIQMNLCKVFFIRIFVFIWNWALKLFVCLIFMTKEKFN